MTLNETLQQASQDYGFLTSEGVATIANYDRLRQILVRCNNGRFVCAAQDVAHFIECIKTSKRDYVRDVSLLAGDPALRGDYRAVTREPKPYVEMIVSEERSDWSHAPENRFDEADCGGAFDGFNVYSDADSGL